MIELCSGLARMPPAGDYTPRKWPRKPGTINQWGGPPPPRFLLTGYPISGRPTTSDQPKEMNA